MEGLVRPELDLDVALGVGVQPLLDAHLVHGLAVVVLLPAHLHLPPLGVHDLDDAVAEDTDQDGHDAEDDAAVDVGRLAALEH